MLCDQYPRSTELGLTPPVGADGFDMFEVRDKLGVDRFADFQQYLADKSVFVCGHRTTPVKVGDKLIECEVHCCYGRDLEAFLSQGGK